MSCLELVGRLRVIWEAEKGVDQWSCNLPSLVHSSQLSTASVDVGPAPVLCRDEGGAMRNREDWKQVTAFSCKGNTFCPLSCFYRTGTMLWEWQTKDTKRQKRKNLCKYFHQGCSCIRAALWPTLTRINGQLWSAECLEAHGDGWDSPQATEGASGCCSRTFLNHLPKILGVQEGQRP